MRVYETAHALAAILPFTHGNIGEAQQILTAVAPEVARATLYDLERQFEAAARQAGMDPGVIRSFTNVVENYRKSVGPADG